MGGRPRIAALIALAALAGGWAAPVTSPGRAPLPPDSQPGPDPAQGPGPTPLPEEPAPSPSPIGAVLRITARVAPDPVIIGTESVYTLTVANTGDTDANDVIVAAVLDHNLTPGGLPGACSLTGRTIACGGPGLTVPAGRSTTYELPVTTDPALGDGTPLTTRAHVTAPGVPGDAAQLTTEAVTRADVELSKTAPASTDGTITYTLTVTNHGPSQATDVTVHDPTRATIADRPAECPGGGPALSCPIGPLPPNESRTLTFTVTPRTTGVIENCATVRTGDREHRTSDNRSCAETLVERPAPAPSRSPGKPGRDEEPEVVADASPEPTPATGKAAASAADRNDVPPPAHHTTPELPLTGASVWMLGLGVAVLLAIGLLVRYFSRRDEPGPDS
ncbi:DUF7507 domain-containing protein [Nonomuraea rubra]|uniref:Putative repeat protein (TIGR01451 family) n=1 Tax=Nonomuraea rubra TaxID=46180 RepID=A0A7X0P2N0_9ACTN|nr:DUF11 domain-containing protein [Nonomuraea rubra]MBB6554154.1 putative repeat protein (TIGR01451 family) [Nonomuraea rubra]